MLAGAGLEPNETTCSGAASLNARRLQTHCYGWFLDLPCPAPGRRLRPIPLGSGRHPGETLQLSAEPHPGLGAVAVDLRPRPHPAPVVQRADVQHHEARQRVRLVHDAEAALGAEARCIGLPVSPVLWSVDDMVVL